MIDMNQLKKKRDVLVEGGRNSSILAGMPWFYFRKWEDMSFPDILQVMCMTITGTKSMQQIYGYNIFPEVQDQIRYDGKTNPPMLGIWQPGFQFWCYCSCFCH